MTTIATRTQTRNGAVKGQPYRFILGHSGTVSMSYAAVHKYLSRAYPKAGRCQECGHLAVTEYAVIHGRSYTRNRADYRELCKGCHRRYDLSQLDWATVAVVQARKAAGETTKALAAEYGVDHHAIRTALAATVPAVYLADELEQAA